MSLEEGGNASELKVSQIFYFRLKGRKRKAAMYFAAFYFLFNLLRCIVF